MNGLRLKSLLWTSLNLSGLSTASALNNNSSRDSRSASVVDVTLKFCDRCVVLMLWNIELYLLAILVRIKACLSCAFIVCLLISTNIANCSRQIGTVCSCKSRIPNLHSEVGGKLSVVEIGNMDLQTSN